MRRSTKIIMALTIAGAGAGGGVAVASTSHAPATPSAVTRQGGVSVPAGTATVNVATAKVGGRFEQVLVDAQGLPLYTYDFDTATQSHVSGALAQAWPPLISTAPIGAGLPGQLSVVTQANVQQVQYDGHFLYTFVNDTPGQITGEGIQGFHVATPALGTEPATANSTPTSPATAVSNPYGY
jgi:predicted lipoprotein with Yx(FWY)xxD motif